MANPASAGARFRAALAVESPLQVVGAVNAYTAMLAQASGFRSIYLSGAGVANASLGLPDLAITTLNDPRIKSFDLAVQTGPTGCAGHPNISTHQKMADTLVAQLQKELGW